jgi:hypothetical protein
VLSVVFLWAGAAHRVNRATLSKSFGRKMVVPVPSIRQWSRDHIGMVVIIQPLRICARNSNNDRAPKASSHPRL